MTSGNSRSGVVLARMPQRRRGHERVAGLMAAASSLFVERGFDATTMTQIAAHAGASIGSLYLFFPTKPALAQALLTDLAAGLSERLDELAARMEGKTAGSIADALFGALACFLEANPVYAVLVDLPGDDAWKQRVRGHRRAQIAALFAGACPVLPVGQAERLATIVPQLMRLAITRGGEPAAGPAVLDEVRLMLRRHLDWPATVVPAGVPGAAM